MRAKREQARRDVNPVFDAENNRAHQHERANGVANTSDPFFPEWHLREFDVQERGRLRVTVWVKHYQHPN